MFALGKLLEGLVVLAAVVVLPLIEIEKALRRRSVAKYGEMTSVRRRLLRLDAAGLGWAHGPPECANGIHRCAPWHVSRAPWPPSLGDGAGFTFSAARCKMTG